MHTGSSDEEPHEPCASAAPGLLTQPAWPHACLNPPYPLRAVCPQLLRTGELGQLSGTPLWSREGLDGDELISEFQKECRIIRRGLEGDLTKVGLGSLFWRGRLAKCKLALCMFGLLALVTRCQPAGCLAGPGQPQRVRSQQPTRPHFRP